MPTGLYGDVVGDTNLNIEIGSFSGGVFTPSSTGGEDAVRVSLARTNARGNPVGTYLMGIVGRNTWDVVAGSTSVFQKTDQCNGNDGIYAHGEVKLTSSANFSADFCLFSKQGVEMSNHNVFSAGAHVAMPDLADCKKCENAHNPGVEEAKLEMNLQLIDVAAHVSSVMDSMLRMSGETTPLNEFLADVSLDGDLTPLSDAGYNTGPISKGDIIEISKSDFQSLSFVPTGLIYAVYCSAPLASFGAVKPSPGGGGGGGGGPKSLSFETPSGSSITDVAVMTDCEIDFGTSAYVQSSVIATSSTSNKSVGAGANAVIGSSSAVCPSSEKVVVMTQGDMSVPAGMETNNVDFLIAGDMHLASGTSTSATKRGTSFYIGGEAHLSAQGTWAACGDGEDSFNGDLKVIRHVVASSPAS
jgi:hypothetical protein